MTRPWVNSPDRVIPGQYDAITPYTMTNGGTTTHPFATSNSFSLDVSALVNGNSTTLAISGLPVGTCILTCIVTTGADITFNAVDGLLSEMMALAEASKTNVFGLQTIDQGTTWTVTRADGHQYGPEITANGTFTNWTAGAPDDTTVLNADANNYVIESVAGGQCRMVSNNTANIAIRPEKSGGTWVTLTNGSMYLVSIDIVAVLSGAVILTLGSGATAVLSAAGSYKYLITAAATGYVQVSRSAACDVTFDNLSVKEWRP